MIDLYTDDSKRTSRIQITHVILDRKLISDYSCSAYPHCKALAHQKAESNTGGKQSKDEGIRIKYVK